MKGHIMKKYLTIILIILVSLSITTACTKKEEAEKTVATPLIRLGYLQSDLHQLAAFVALKKNFFTDEGLNVEIGGIFKAGPQEMTAFAAGSLDAGYVGEAPATTAVANNAAEVSVVAQVNLEGSSIVIRNDSEIKDVKVSAEGE